MRPTATPRSGVAGCRPEVVAGARANRQFLGRVVRYPADLATTRSEAYLFGFWPRKGPKTEQITPPGLAGC